MNSIRYRFVLLVLAFWLVPLSAQAGDLQGALAYVPSDAMSVTGADVDRLRSSPLFAPVFDAIVKESGARQELAKFQAQTGVDVRKDVHSFVAAFSKEFPKDDDQFLIVVEAKVSEKRFVAFAKKEGAKLQRKGSPYGPYWSIDGGDGALAFRGKYVLLGGHKTFMKGLAASRGKAARTRGKLGARLGSVSSHDVFVVAELPPKVRQKIRGALPGGGDVLGTTITLDVQRGFHLHGTATMNGKKAAQQVASFAQAGLDEVRKDPSFKKMGLDSYLSRISVHATGRNVEASVVLTNKQTQRLIKLLPML